LTSISDFIEAVPCPHSLIENNQTFPKLDYENSSCPGVGTPASEKFPPVQKKRREKALIPLPPTDLVSFFFANSDVVKPVLWLKRAQGFTCGYAVSICARFCKEMQCGCTVTLEAVTVGVGLEAQIS